MVNYTEYTLKIIVHEHMVNDAARHLIPRLIRDFGVSMKVKLALVTSIKSVEISATKEVATGAPYMSLEDFPLVPNQDLDNPER